MTAPQCGQVDVATPKVSLTPAEGRGETLKGFTLAGDRLASQAWNLE